MSKNAGKIKRYSVQETITNKVHPTPHICGTLLHKQATSHFRLLVTAACLLEGKCREKNPTTARVTTTPKAHCLLASPIGSVRKCLDVFLSPTTMAGNSDGS